MENEKDKQIETLSVLMQLNKDTIKKLLHLLNLVPSHELLEQVNEDESIFLLRLADYGVLKMTDEPDGLHYQFFPSKDFSDIIKQTLKNKQSMLVKEVEQEVRDKYLKIYEGLK